MAAVTCILHPLLLQCYLGGDCRVSLTLPSSPPPASGGNGGVLYEARVRCCASCGVNGGEEQLWSSYGPAVAYRREKAEFLKRDERTAAEGEEEEEGVASKEGRGKGKAGWTLGVLFFVVLTLCTVLLALILGQMAV